MAEDSLFGEYLAYLEDKSCLTKNTLLAYHGDINDYAGFLGNGKKTPLEAGSNDIVKFLWQKRDSGAKPATLKRLFVSVKRFHAYLVSSGKRNDDPVLQVAPIRLVQSSRQKLPAWQLDRLVNFPQIKSGGSVFVLRDQALLWLIRTIGITASEASSLNEGDITFGVTNRDEAYVRIIDVKGREKLQLLERKVRQLLELYLDAKRKRWPQKPLVSNMPLFVSTRGNRLNRLGVWRCVKRCAKRSGVNVAVNPRMLRATLQNCERSELCH